MSKKNSKAKQQTKVRQLLAYLGHKEYINKDSMEIVKLLESLYPECVTTDEMSKTEKIRFAFSHFIELEQYNFDFIKEKEKKKFNQYMIALNILKRLGYVDGKEPTSKSEIYQLIKQIHPELAVVSGAPAYMKRTFSTFIRLYTDTSLSETDKKEILQKAQEARDRKINRVKNKKLKQATINGAKTYKDIREEFYRSIEWQSVRYNVLKEQGGKCQLCGRSRKDGIVLHVDHIIPLSKDWSKRLDKNNLQVLCEDCNMGKSNTDSIDWR